MNNIWLQQSGFDLGTIQERQIVNVTLPTATTDNVEFRIISGNVPPGLRLVNNALIGSAFEVSRPTTFTFVIRATQNGIISDRTFKLTVEGYDVPQWLTPSGLLKVNPNNRSLFVIDGTYVDFQLQAIDNDLPAGENLEFFIADDDGELPVGLTLMPEGRITGFIDPILALDITAGEGFYDTNFFDTIIYDPGVKAKTGMDTYLYDTTIYDYFDSIRTPRKLNRTYEFRVSVSDGETIVKRHFKIYVVGDDFLRADNAITQIGNGLFTADNTYFRGVVWLTARNLGIKRANNYVSVFLDTFDPNPQAGPVYYELLATNDDLSPSELPPGVLLDHTNGELFGYVPYQPAITKEFKFTVNAIKYDKSAITETEIIISLFDTATLGQRSIKIYPLLNTKEISTLVNNTLRIGNTYYRVNNYQSPDVTGHVYALLDLDRPLTQTIVGRDVGNNPTQVRRTFVESTLSYNTVGTRKTFIISVLGEVDSAVRYVTPNNLGSIRANLPSTLSIVAESTVPEAIMSYKVVSGLLPPGLELSISGEIVGKVRQFGNENTPGLTIFDTDRTTFDNADTSFDRSYTFTVLAFDQYRYSAILGDFTISAVDPDDRLYSNIFVRPFQKRDKRTDFYNFISDQTIFTPSKIYRPNDPEFGVQRDLKMLVYAGLETTKVSSYITALKTNIKRRRLRLGDLSISVARQSGSNKPIYEVIYLEVFDDYENANGVTVSDNIHLSKINKFKILANQAKINVTPGTENIWAIDRLRSVNDPLTVDSKSLKISDTDLNIVYPSGIENIRNKLKNIVIEDHNEYRNLITEREFLPLWMTTQQSARTAANGYVKAVPLCYCIPGEGHYILENIKNSNFDFKSIDYEIDRFIIDSTTGNSESQYLKFNNYKHNV